ncbi:MAG: cell division protein ZapA [Candidatus Cloacimonetes bacterium]|nr:cell division protein ZapA [Candidatus Cloacimonadota bacterium]
MNSIFVNIFGDEYSIAGDVDPTDIKKYAEYLDEKLTELSVDTNIESKYKLSILCGLNIIEEMFTQKEQLSEVEKYLKKISNLLDSFSAE